MQTLKKSFYDIKLKTTFLKYRIANFSGSNWISNNWTGEASTRHTNANTALVNGYSLFHNNRTQPRTKVPSLAKNSKNRDFPSVTARLAFLTGQSK